MATTNSPPPPTLPTSSAPGERAKKLRDVHARALKNALKPVSQYENFAACFPTPAKYCEDALRQLHSDFVRKLGTTCETEFEALLHEREVVASLNQLDALVEDAKKRKAKTESEGNGESEASMPPHLLEPSQLLQLHLQPFLSEQSRGLQTRLEAAQAENKQLAGDIETQRGEIDALLSGLEGLVSDLEGANRALESDEMDGITQVLRS